MSAGIAHELVKRVSVDFAYYRRIVNQIPEVLFGATVFQTTNPLVWMPKEFCHAETPFLTQLKALGAYTIPHIDVQVAGTLQSIPGRVIAANYVLSSADAARSLGRPLSGYTPNMTVDLVSPGSVLTDRLNQLDVRVGRIFRMGDRRIAANLDTYNLTNSDTVTAVNQNYATLWRPTGVLQARFVKVSLQLNY
jgi:hypothetical protein